jgi:hypothetical protein
MNIVLSAIRNPGRLTCTWVPTGNARAPLACIWKEAAPSRLYLVADGFRAATPLYNPCDELSAML